MIFINNQYEFMLCNPKPYISKISHTASLFLIFTPYFRVVTCEWYNFCDVSIVAVKLSVL